MKFEDSYLFTALELVNRAMTEDESGVFDAEAACAIAAQQVTNLGLVQKLWDERGVKILLTAWSANRHYFIPPVKTEEEDVPEEEVSAGARFDPPESAPAPSRRFGAAKRTVVWPRPFNTKVILHRDGYTSLEIRFGDIKRAEAEPAYDYRRNQLEGRQENLDAGYGALLSRDDFEGTTRVYDIFKNDPDAALEILRHIEKVER